MGMPAIHGEDDLLPVSALQHLVFCARQCMLVYAELVWAENRHTAEGRLLHERVHERQSGTEQGIPVARGLRLVSYRLGLSGVADFVEYHPATDASTGVELPGRSGRWVPYPVEYKRGRPKAHDADAVQLCAQALCLEEMLQTAVPAGALFYGQTRRRAPVEFTADLRARVEQLAARLHELFESGVTPPPEPGPKCKHCSLKGDCLPDLPTSAAAYLRRMVRQTIREV